MNQREFIKELKALFVDNTKCNLQDNGKRSCNSCFHAQKGNFNHITWLIVLGLSKGYKKENIIKDIKKELKKRMGVLNE